MLSKWPKNAPIDQKWQFKRYRDATLTWFEFYPRNFAWKCTLNQSCST